jgi:hypothetical protein
MDPGLRFEGLGWSVDIGNGERAGEVVSVGVTVTFSVKRVGPTGLPMPLLVSLGNWLAYQAKWLR